MARGAFPDAHPLHMGMPGMHGTVAAVGALQRDRPADLARRPVRRPGDRPAVLVRPAREGRPRRHRPGRDLQEPHRRRADRGRLQGGHHRADRGTQAASTAGRRPGLQRLAHPARRRPGQVPARLRRAGRRQPLPAVRDPADRRDRRAGRDLRRRCRPAPDVGRAVRPLRAARALAQLRRPRHDGLRRAGRDGGQGRRRRQDGLGDRRRRLLPDDQPGAGHLRAQRHPDQGRGDQQLSRWAWSGSGRRCSTTAVLQHRPAHRPAIPDFAKLAEAMGCVGLRC